MLYIPLSKSLYIMLSSRQRVSYRDWNPGKGDLLHFMANAGAHPEDCTKHCCFVLLDFLLLIVGQLQSQLVVCASYDLHDATVIRNVKDCS